MQTFKIIGIDAGSTKSGIIILENSAIKRGYNVENEKVVDFIQLEAQGCDRMTVVIEDVRPYNMRITNGIIATIKYIGQLEWRLQSLGVRIVLVPRWQVKQWIYLQFKSIALPAIDKKVIYSTNRKIKQGIDVKRIPTGNFVWVDDRIIVEAMRKHWNIPKVRKVGEATMYDLRDHSWQALALVSYYLASS